MNSWSLTLLQALPALPSMWIASSMWLTHARYAVLSEELRALGFREDMAEEAPICRWRIEGVPLDIMPVSEQVLGAAGCA